MMECSVGYYDFGVQKKLMSDFCINNQSSIFKQLCHFVPFKNWSMIWLCRENQTDGSAAVYGNNSTPDYLQAQCDRLQQILFDPTYLGYHLIIEQKNNIYKVQL